MKAVQAMTTPVVTIHLDASIDEAAQSLAEHSIHALPVVEANGKLAGLVTARDVVHAVSRQGLRVPCYDDPVDEP